MRKGELISVNAGEDKLGSYYLVNLDVIEEHGCLWLLIKRRKAESPLDAGRKMWNCRSLATGYLAVWFEDEMTEPEDGE